MSARRPDAALLITALAGVVLGFFCQENWAQANREALGAARALLGALAGGLVLPALAWAWSRLWARPLRRLPREVLTPTAAALAAVAAAWLLPSWTVLDNGAMLAAVILALAAGAVMAGLHRGAGPALALLLVVLALAYVIWHHQLTGYYDRSCLEKIIKGNADAPLRYRLLLPWLSAGLANLFAISLDQAQFLLRCFVTFCVFALGARVCALFVKGPLIWATPFVQMALMPFSFQLRYYSDETEVLGVWLLLWAAARTRLAWSLVVVLVFALNRETLLLLGPWWFLTALALAGPERRGRVVLAAAAMVVGVMAEQALLVLAYGLDFQPGDYLSGENLALLGRWADFLSPRRLLLPATLKVDVWLGFMGGAWLAAIAFSRRLPLPLRLGLWINLPFLVLVQVFLGRCVETRQLFLLVPFITAALIHIIQSQAGTGAAASGEPPPTPDSSGPTTAR